MSGSIAHSRASQRLARTIWSALALSALLVGCRPESEASAPQVRPVRTVTVEKHEAGSPVTLTGRIEAKDEVALGFRISGRLLENKTKLGDRVRDSTNVLPFGSWIHRTSRFRCAMSKSFVTIQRRLPFPRDLLPEIS